MTTEILRGENANEGHCPLCGSIDYETVDSGIEDDYYYYESECDHCRCVWRDWYRLTFVEQEYWPLEETQRQNEEQERYQKQLAERDNPINIEKALKCLNSVAGLISNGTYKFLKEEIYNEENKSFYQNYGYFSVYNFVARLRDLVGLDFDMETCRPKPTTSEFDSYIP